MNYQLLQFQFESRSLNLPNFITNKLPIDDLDFALDEYESGNDKVLLELVEEIFEKYSIKQFHVMYWKLYDQDPSMSHLDCYEELKFSLIKIFFDQWTNNQLAMEYFYILDDRLLFLLNSIIDTITTNNNYSSSIHKVLAGHSFKGDFQFVKLLTVLDPSFQFEKLNKNQEILFNQYNQTSPKTIPDIGRKKGDCYYIFKSKVVNERSKFDNNYLLRMYLLGEKEINIKSYDHLTTGKISKNAFDEFLIWFWKWAQEQKPSEKIVPGELKLYCTEILCLTVQNNTAIKYSKRDFNIRNVEQSWRNFRTATNDAKKRIKDNSIK